MGRPSLKDIAQVLGYSVSTVSRSLNNKGEIDPKTRERIREKAREMGYVPNYAARSLKGKNSQLIGVIIDDNTNPFYAEVFKGMEREAQKRGYHLLLINTHSSLEDQEYALSLMKSRGVDGLLVAPVRDTNPEDLEGVKLPFVIVGRHFDGSDFYEVYNDEVLGGYLATRHLIEDGKRCPLHIRSRLDLFPARGRLEGYLRALNEVGMGECPVLAVERDPAEIPALLEGFLDSGGKFDGIFAYNDLYAMETLLFLKKRGIAVPKEVSVVGYDNIPYSAYTSPSLTSVALDEIWLGKKSVSLLTSLLEGKKPRKKQWIQKPILNVKESG
ncbi:MAG TPA: LacI family DNA-binding transcriptional regulator [Thermotogota bacterium]|nr:LacI family DNA-binding transcriptional regulator [Thermotogota bacterium]HRW91513.1 LacI family DNA-binding transcriptional regulator [Thermotogota bacterium]